MRRALRRELPALRHVFPGLTWDEILDMPAGELEAHRDFMHEMNAPG